MCQKSPRAYWCSFFLFVEDISPFRGATDTSVLDFWQRLPWVSKPGWIPCLCTLSPACNEFLRFTSGVTPADCIEVSMAAEPFQSTYLQTCPQALVEAPNPRPSVPHERRCRPLGHSGSDVPSGCLLFTYKTVACARLRCVNMQWRL